VSDSLSDNPTHELSSQRCLSLVAHPDDDLLFMNPDIVAGIRAYHETRTVFLTSWENPELPGYWQRREQGIREAYAHMADVPSRWHTELVTLGDSQLEIHALVDAPYVSIALLHLPDNASTGPGVVTLRDLYDHPSSHSRIKTIDGRYSYTYKSLTNLLTVLMEEFRPTLVRIQNPYATLDNSPETGVTTSTPPYADHPDHIRTAKFAHLAHQAYAEPHDLLCYRNYDIQNERVNLRSMESREKLGIFEIYAKHDDLIGEKCAGHPGCAPWEQFFPWTDRRYCAIAP
jgi:LmbE family N-acetylglucosaminyl deacetylase